MKHRVLEVIISVNWLVIIALLATIAAVVLVLVDKDNYPVAVVLALAAITCAVLAPKDPEGEDR